MKIKTGNQNKRRFYDGILQALTYLSSGISVLVLVALFVFIFSRGWSSINMDLLTNNYWSENYNVEPVSEVADTTFERPADLSEEAYFSEKWGVAFVDHVNAHKEEMILVEYIDENSPLYAMSDVSIRSNPQDFTMQVGMQVSRLSYTNEQGDTQLAGIGGQTAQDVAQALDQATSVNSMFIQTTGGGTMNAANLDVETQENSAAAIRSDRGGGTVNVDGGSYVTNGTGSPAIYCTADISVSDATLTANASEGVVVEGKNSVALTDCEVTGNMSNTYNGDSDENIHCIMIYQSMSGDADVGEATFSAEGGSITAKTGDMFYITNTDCEITLKDVAFTLANDVFLRVEGNSSSRGWGTEGANGGDVTLTADSQEFAGNILVDEISSLALTMKNGTSYEGAINPDGDGGTVDVTLDDDSTWTLTGDSYITSFDGDTSNITANGYHLYVNGEQVL